MVSPVETRQGAHLVKETAAFVISLNELHDHPDIVVVLGRRARRVLRQFQVHFHETEVPLLLLCLFSGQLARCVATASYVRHLQ